MTVPSAVERAAACIWGEITDEFWSLATPEQRRRYIGIARAALTVAGMELTDGGEGEQ